MMRNATPKNDLEVRKLNITIRLLSLQIHYPPLASDLDIYSKKLIKPSVWQAPFLMFS